MRSSTAAASFAAAALLAAALSSCSSTPATMTVHGTVTVPDNPAAGEPSPVSDTSQVTVTDPSGKVLAFTTLDGDAPQGRTFTLTYGFTVKVPEGESSYGVHVAGLDGTTQFTQAKMKAGPAVCAGTAC